MARYIPSNTVTQALLGITQPPRFVNEITHIAGKVHRAQIAIKRGQLLPYNPTGYTDGLTDFQTVQKANAEINPRPIVSGYQSGLTTNPAGKAAESDRASSRIILFDLDYNDKKHKASRKYNKLELPFVPREVQFTPDSKFVGIASIGRNNPRYHFTGSEDTLEFTIDWFTDDPERKDVIQNCRWVEALTKADGYNERPHRIKLIWGQDDELWKDTQWIVVKAPYKLSNWAKNSRDSQGNLYNGSMRPSQAYQTITLKRVTKFNLRTKNIIKAS